VLCELRVENLLLIERASLDLRPGLNVLTGETGAGKTVLAHALDLLLGGRARSGIVRPGAPDAYVEGIFDVGGEDLVLARRVTAEGRTRAYVDHRSATVGELRERAERLIAFYGQHEHRRLTLAGAQLAALDDERRAFLASASHELRTPISNVKVTLEALESGAAEDPELRDRFLRTAVEEIDRMAGLIHDLLDLGRLEAGVAPIDRQATDVRFLVDRLARAMEPRLREAGVAVDIDLVDAPLSIDTERVLQALFSIVDNALKFAPAGSTVRVRSWIEGERVMLSISDRGPGITPAHLPRVFDQFFTADPARARGGTGLGLAIARKIIEAHGGSIAVTSEPGAGATFTVALPLREASVVAA
jgi:signal transduction histidine kinase